MQGRRKSIWEVQQALLLVWGQTWRWWWLSGGEGMGKGGVSGPGLCRTFPEGYPPSPEKKLSDQGDLPWHSVRPCPCAPPTTASTCGHSHSVGPWLWKANPKQKLTFLHLANKSFNTAKGRGQGSQFTKDFHGFQWRLSCIFQMKLDESCKKHLGRVLSFEKKDLFMEMIRTI